MSIMKELTHKDGDVEGVECTVGMYTDRVEDLEHNLTVTNTKMDAIIEGTDASLKQLTQMFADAVEQQGEFNREMNRRNQNTNKRISKEIKELGSDISFVEARTNLLFKSTADMTALIGKIDTQYGQATVLLSTRLDNVYSALAVIFGLLLLILVLVGYILFTGA